LHKHRLSSVRAGVSDLGWDPSPLGVGEGRGAGATDGAVAKAIPTWASASVAALHPPPLWVCSLPRVMHVSGNGSKTQPFLRESSTLPLGRFVPASRALQASSRSCLSVFLSASDTPPNEGRWG